MPFTSKLHVPRYTFLLYCDVHNVSSAQYVQGFTSYIVVCDITQFPHHMAVEYHIAVMKARHMQKYAFLITFGTLEDHLTQNGGRDELFHKE